MVTIKAALLKKKKRKREGVSQKYAKVLFPIILSSALEGFFFMLISSAGVMCMYAGRGGAIDLLDPYHNVHNEAVS